MKGLLLAGGTGSRLWPATVATSKQLLPVYDKPMIYYPLASLMELQVREILVISSPRDLSGFQRLLGTGRQWGIQIEYAEQSEPRGIAEALLIGHSFTKDDAVALILGDNILHGVQLASLLGPALGNGGATILATKVINPQQYGIVEIAENGRILSIEEKPLEPKSNLAIPGLYLLDHSASTRARSLRPSERGELEITDVLTSYLSDHRLKVVTLPVGTVWLDAGTVEDLYAATEYVRVIEQRQGIKIGCVEEVAWRNGWISTKQLRHLEKSLEPSKYAAYLGTLGQ